VTQPMMLSLVMIGIRGIGGCKRPSPGDGELLGRGFAHGESVDLARLRQDMARGSSGQGAEQSSQKFVFEGFVQCGDRASLFGTIQLIKRLGTSELYVDRLAHVCKDGVRPCHVTGGLRGYFTPKDCTMSWRCAQCAMLFCALACKPIKEIDVIS
jgi:hypothetical protein